MGATAVALASICLLPVARATPPMAEFTIHSSAVDAAGRLESEVREGYVSLSWSAGEGTYAYELQSALSGSFADAVVRYTGPDTTSFISGLETGDHHFRVRARAEGSEPWGPWSEAVIVPVRHHSMTMAWWLFGLGAGLFGVLVAFLLANARRVETGARDG